MCKQVVTGATDGIGKVYARRVFRAFLLFFEYELIARVLQLAEAGLNIVLISRTQHKLTNVADEISIQIILYLEIQFHFTLLFNYRGKMQQAN